MAEQKIHSHAKLFLWLGILVCVLVVLSVFALFFTISKPTPAVTSETIRTGEAPRPVFTEAAKRKVAASRGFQALISYTDTGFQPAAVAIKVGETVRFTNNSSGVLNLTTNGVSESVAVQDFFEYTFEAAGEYGYASGAGSVLIRVW